jgi:hypothetical protein
MGARTASAQRIWAISGGAGLAFVVGALALFRAPAVVVAPPAAPARTVELRQVTEARTVLNEETALRDLAPLFLPTEQNAGLRRFPAREPGRTFLDVEAPKLGIGDRAWRFDRALPELATLNSRRVAEATPLDYLQSVADDVSLAGLGRMQAVLPVAEARAATVEVVRLRDGKVVLAQSIPADRRPPTDKPWQPLELLANVGPAGLIAPLSLSVRSGVDDVDAFFRTFLARTFQIGEQLAPGFYRIRVSP